MKFDLFKKNKSEQINDGMPYKYTDADEDVQVGLKDRFAMWISGVLIIGIPCFAMIVLIVLVTLLLFGGKM